MEPTEEQIYQHMIEALGIDLGDPYDRIAQLVRVGMRDLNPTRVLQDCEHLFISLGASGLISNWLRLPTMGQKTIHCTRHRFSVTGSTLDGANKVFRSNYCDHCPDRARRPLDWKYSPEWQESENERHKDYVQGFRGPTGPPLPQLPLPPDIVRQMKTETGQE
jgi:hypothetical protein